MQLTLIFKSFNDSATLTCERILTTINNHTAGVPQKIEFLVKQQIF
jgi:hypothetical protein